MVARARLAQGKVAEGRAAFKRAQDLARGTANLPLSFEIADTSARFAIAGAHAPNRSSAAKAERELESSLAVARKSGYLEYQFRLRLALGEIEMESGAVSRGQARLKAVAADASSKGFNLVAREATSASKANAIAPSQASSLR